MNTKCKFFRFVRSYETFRNDALCARRRKPITARYSGRAVFTVV